jgi:hypothetical protein
LDWKSEACNVPTKPITRLVWNACSVTELPRCGSGEQRFCGNFPALAAGMPGIYVPDESVPMFYPEAWKYRYGILARTENIRQTTPTNSPNT